MEEKILYEGPVIKKLKIWVIENKYSVKEDDILLFEGKTKEKARNFMFEKVMSNSSYIHASIAVRNS